MTFYYVYNCFAILKTNVPSQCRIFFITVFRVGFIFGFETEFDLCIKNDLESTYFQIRNSNDFTPSINEPDTWKHMILVKKSMSA